MTVLYIIAALLMLTFIVSLHELGHYLIGRTLGIGIVEYSIGMGPKLFGWKKSHKIRGTEELETIKYSVRLLPLGGFCAFLGEDEANPDPRAMNNVPAWKRFLTVLAGPAMNFVLAFVITVGLIATGSINNVYNPKQYIEINELMEDMPAARAGLLPGDRLLAVDSHKVGFDSDGNNTLRPYLATIQEGQKVTVTVLRGDEELTLTVVPEQMDGQLLMGFKYDNMPFEAYDVGLFEAVPESFSFMWKTVKATYRLLADLVRKLFVGEKIPEGTVTGVVGIVAGASEDMKAGFGAGIGDGFFVIVYYIMAISLSLGIMNLLPLPALDGGRLVALLFEMVTGKHLDRRVEGIINLVGLGLLLLLMVFVTYSDIRTLLK